MERNSKYIFSSGEISIQVVIIIILMLIGLTVVLIISSGVGGFGTNVSSNIMGYLADAIGA